MTWKVYEPKTRSGLADGQAAISMGGALRVTVDELEKAGITGRDVVVELDPEEQRISLRAPASKRDPAMRLSGDGGSRSLNAKSVLQALGVTPEEAAGRHPTTVNANRLIVMLPKKAKRATPIGGRS